MQIDVSFNTWKGLTALLTDENDSYDAVVARLLTDKNADERPVSPPSACSPEAAQNGAYFKDIFLPNGTELRATHKGKTYFAKISGSEWVDETTGEKRSSPSQAAYFITHNHVNGWLFWLVRRPGEEAWNSLNALRASRSL